MPSLGMGRIFTIGSTAAMAWNLPNEPMVFLDKKEKFKKKSEDNTPQNIGYHSYYEDHENENTEEKYYSFENFEKMDRPQFSYYPRDNYGTFTRRVEPEHWHIYRRTRRSLYGKLEKFMTALNKDGRACILKIICEVSQIANRKGTFMEEIVKVIFRIKTHKTLNEDVYDAAANEKHNCRERYKSCPWSYFGET